MVGLERALHCNLRVNCCKWSGRHERVVCRLPRPFQCKYCLLRRRGAARGRPGFLALGNTQPSARLSEKLAPGSSWAPPACHTQERPESVPNMESDMGRSEQRSDARMTSVSLIFPIALFSSLLFPPLLLEVVQVVIRCDRCPSSGRGRTRALGGRTHDQRASATDSNAGGSRAYLVVVAQRLATQTFVSGLEIGPYLL